MSQLDFLGGTKVAHVELDIATIKLQPSMQAAIGLCISVSGKARKQIFGALQIDPATASRIESGQANFPPNDLSHLMDLCGNEAPLIWLTETRGYDFSTMRKHRSNEQRRIAELEQENNDLKRAFQLAFGAKK